MVWIKTTKRQSRGWAHITIEHLVNEIQHAKAQKKETNVSINIYLVLSKAGETTRAIEWLRQIAISLNLPATNPSSKLNVHLTIRLKCLCPRMINHLREFTASLPFSNNNQRLLCHLIPSCLGLSTMLSQKHSSPNHSTSTINKIFD